MTKARELAQQVNAVMGEGTVLIGSDPALTVGYLPTGVLPMDVLLGGGFPRGRSVELYGDYSTLKSYMALRAIATTQDAGGTCAIIDTEHAFDPEWAEALGVSVDDLIYQSPETGEKAVSATEVMLRAGSADLIVWDSVAASQPQQYAEKKPGEDNQVAGLARMMSATMRRLNSLNKQTALVFINQTRVNVGITYGGAKDVVPGGKALGFYASMRVRLVKAGKLTRDVHVHDGEKLVASKETTAIKIKGVLEKSKLNKPLRETWFLFDLEEGLVDEVAFLISQGIEHGLVAQKGAFFSIPGYSESKYQGMAKFKSGLADDEGAQQWLMEQMDL